jgi:tetratricopeptide (TPR) repeat protein
MQQSRKIGLLILMLFTTSVVSAQTEALKTVVNSLAFYKQKNDLVFLGKAKKSADSLIVTRSDSADIDKNLYRLIVNASILYTDSLNKLGQSENFLDNTAGLFDKLSDNKKAYKYQSEFDYSKRCITNAYVRKGFALSNNGDFNKAVIAFQQAKKYSPDFKPVNSYIAYASNKMGNLQDAAKYYSNLVSTDSTKIEYLQTAASVYKSIGDTAKALQILKKGRRLFPADKQILQDEANIYNNKKDYKSLEPLLNSLVENNSNNADITFVAANCYDNLNQFEKAESFYLRAIELNGSAFDPVFNLGLLYFKLSTLKNDDGAKNITSAILWLEKANEMIPGDKKSLQLLQLAYTKTGNQNQLERVTDKLEQLTN